MHRSQLGVLLAIALVACAAPAGAERTGCGADWLDAEPVVATGTGVREEEIAIGCIDPVANSRLRIGFMLPAGPSCHVLRRIELVESADAVSITLVGAVSDDPNAGACPDESRRVITEIDLQAPVDDRQLLDGAVN